MIEAQHLTMPISNPKQWVSQHCPLFTFPDSKQLSVIRLPRCAGKYYAVEDMLTTQPSEKFGTITLKQHYERIAREGQEYDPYTTL
jgi:hypothetical protein